MGSKRRSIGSNRLDRGNHGHTEVRALVSCFPAPSQRIINFPANLTTAGTFFTHSAIVTIIRHTMLPRPPRKSITQMWNKMRAQRSAGIGHAMSDKLGMENLTDSYWQWAGWARTNVHFCFFFPTRSPRKKRHNHRNRRGSNPKPPHLCRLRGDWARKILLHY